MTTTDSEATPTATLVPDLVDLLSTAVEGGIGYWCRVEDYRWDPDRHATTDLGVTVAEWVDDGDDDLVLPRRITLADLEAACWSIVTSRYGEDPTQWPRTGYTTAASCARLLTGGDPDFDSDTADQVFQTALLGTVVFA